MTYSVDGQLNLTVVNGASYTGLYAADGSWNIVTNPGSAYTGYYHPCGAVNAVVVTDPSSGRLNANGSLNVILNLSGGYSPVGFVSNSSQTPAPYLNTTSYRFASSRLRTPLQNGVVAAGSEFRIDVSEFWSPTYITNKYRIAIPMHYTRTDGGLPSENPASNVINFEGVKIGAFISGSWTLLDATYLGSTSFSIDPATNSVGILLDDVTFGSNVPANTRMQVRICSNVAPGGSMIANYAPSQSTGRIEWAIVSATTLTAQLGLSTKPTGTDGRIGGAVYSPSFVIAKPTVGLDRPVFFVNGDSIGFGKNEFETFSTSNYLALGFIGRALDDDLTSRRMPYFNMCVPSVGVEQKDRSGWARKLDLIRLCPNRPYTHIITEHYNNGWLTATYRSDFNAYYNLLKNESRYWGDGVAQIYQSRPIPRPSSTNWCTTLAGQPSTNEALTDIKWAGFDADLISGYFTQLTGTINTNRDYAYDQATNRNKIKLTGFTTTLAADYTSGATTASLVDPVNVNDQLVFNTASGTGATYVRAVSGTGPYTVTIFQGVSGAKLTGASIVSTFSGDQIGLHPSTPGHSLIAPVWVDWKNATFG